MSILGYSSSYFLPQYWASTPLYGEKLIPLIDYVLSVDYEKADGLANAFYAIENKYRNISNLPIECVEDLIDENGYSYVKDMLGNDEDGLRLLVNLIVLVHQLKGTKTGIYVVLNLLKKDDSILVMQVVGSPTISSTTKDVTDFSTSDYLLYSNVSASSDPFSLTFKIKTPSQFSANECIASLANKGFYLGINTAGRLALSLGSDRLTWDVADNKLSDKVLNTNTYYYVRLSYDGDEYKVDVSTDNETFSNYITVENSQQLNIVNGLMYLGVDGTTNTIASPFLGSINCSNMSINVEDIGITEWFEQMPVREENTFLITTNLDVDLISSDFFSNFANFIKNYVYPSLEAFTAKISFSGNLTFLPYVRERVTYVAFSDVTPRDNFLVKTTEESLEATDLFIVNGDLGDEIFTVIHEDED